MTQTRAKWIAAVCLLLGSVVLVVQLGAQGADKKATGKKDVKSVPVLPGTEEAQILVSAQIVSVPVTSPAWQEINSSEALAESILGAVEVGDVEVLSEPMILVLNGQRGQEKIATTTPYLVTDNETMTKMPSEVEVWTMLGVTPVITKDGRILITVEVQQGLTTDLVTGPDGKGALGKSYGGMAGRAAIGNNETVVLEGLCTISGHQPADDEAEEGAKEIRELYVLATPQVVNPDVLPAELQELLATE